MELKLDEGLKTLIDSGKVKGYLTYSQVNEFLPDDAVNPEKLDQLLILLEEQGIDLIDEAEIDERESKNGKLTAEPADEIEAELPGRHLALLEEQTERTRTATPPRINLTQRC